MKSRYLLPAILIGTFLLILFGVSTLPASEAKVVSTKATVANTEALNDSPIAVTETYTTYLPIVFDTTKIYCDDFSDSDSGWPLVDNSQITMSYQSGEYEIAIREDFYWAGAVPPLDDIFSYSVEAEARLYTGSEGVYGLVFDREDWSHFYVFVVIPSSQLYGVLRNDSGWVTVIPFTSSSAINPGAALNKLKVERMGDQISVHVNDQFLATDTDSTFTGTVGEVGLFAQSFNEFPIAVRFDEFCVRQISGVTITTLSPQAVISTERSGQGADGLRPGR